MELNIREVNQNDMSYNDPLYIQPSFEQIPENTVPVKVIKKGVRFQETQKPIHQAFPHQNAKITRPMVVPQKPKISYEEILSKMGMFVSQGKLHLLDENQKQLQQLKQVQLEQQQVQQKPQYEVNPNIPQNSYIYNKYFSDQTPSQNNIRQPLTLLDYRNMLIQDALQKQRIKQIKSTKLLMPTSNINLASGSSNLNKLFNFSKR
jgi:hypothetical protein